MYLAKSIDELYEEVKGYDLVLCNDAPLALALNNRLDSPRVGVFAITPRQLAADLSMDILGQPLLSDIEVVRRLAQYSNNPLRFVHGEVENFKTIRRYTSDVRRYLRGNKSKDIFDDYVRLNTLEKVMDSFDGRTEPFFTGKRIAVIGLELYDALDKNFNPPEGMFDDIELFKEYDERSFRIPVFRELYNDHQIAENAVDMISEKNASDVAIVFDVNGKIADAVRSELYRRGLPFINDLSIRDLNNIRDFIEFIRRSQDFKITKVSQIRELLQTYGGSINPKYDEYLIENYGEMGIDCERTIQLLEIMKDISDMTYGDVCDMIAGSEGAQVKLLLSQLELTKKKVNVSDTADMIYSVNNFELKHNEQIPNKEKEGVLLVDCRNSVYIDRPIVLFLGMGPEWERDLSDLNLIDYRLKDSIIEKDVIKFQILLQQGTSRTYICNSIRNGKRAKPCAYFEMADYPAEAYYGDGEEKKLYEGFSDIAECITGPWYEHEGKEVERVGVAGIMKDKEEFQFSNTTFNQFITCPKKFMFGSIIKSPDNEHNAIGISLHEYAEFRTCFPQKAKELGQEYFVKDITDRCVPLFSPETRGIRASKIRSAVKDIDELIDSQGLDVGNSIIEKERKHNNRYFALVGMDRMGSDCNEVKIVDTDRHMNGILDLVKDGRVFDFKTGRPKKVGGVKEAVDIEKTGEYGKDMQYLFYLSLMLSEGIKRPSFTYFSTSFNEINDALGQDADLNNGFINVRMVKDKMECIRMFLPPELAKKNRKNYGAFIDGCDTILDMLDDVGAENLLSDKDIATDLMLSRLDIKDNKTNRTNANVVLNIIGKITKPFFSDGNTIYVTADEMEWFRGLVERSYDEVQRMYDTEFPADPLMKCKNCEFRDMCISVEGGDSDE